MKNPRLSIVVPIFNEAGAISRFMELIDSTFRGDIGLDYECVLVDDGSVDDSWEEICELSDRYPIRAFRLSRNFGKEAALCAGLEKAHGDGVVVMDCDLQHPPELLPRMVSLWMSTGCDMVEARKTRAQYEPFYSKWRARAFYWLFSKLCGIDLEGLCDYKLLSRKVRKAWLDMPERGLFFRGMTAWLGFHREFVEFQVPDIAERESRWSLPGLVDYATRNITAFSTVPLYLLTSAGLLFLLPAAGLACWLVYLKVIGIAITSDLVLILLILLAGGLNMMGLALIGLYVSRIYEETKSRPRYILSEELRSSHLPAL
jgi:polyisoprenyl-phosphate glycosyltransferase